MMEQRAEGARRRALWLVGIGVVIWLGYAVTDALKEPAPPPAPASAKSLALRHIEAESQNAFWTGGRAK